MKARFLENQVVRGKRRVDAHHNPTIPCSVLALLLPHGTLLGHQGILRCCLHAEGMFMWGSHCRSWVSWFLPHHVVSNSPIICTGGGAATGFRPTRATWHAHRYWVHDFEKWWGMQIHFTTKTCGRVIPLSPAPSRKGLLRVLWFYNLFTVVVARWDVLMAVTGALGTPCHMGGMRSPCTVGGGDSRGVSAYGTEQEW